MSKTTLSENELALTELKRQAKQLKGDPAIPNHQKRLEAVANLAGFQDFRHARRVLTGWRASSGSSAAAAQPFAASSRCCGDR